jgi:hypothetical protein
MNRYFVVATTTIVRHYEVKAENEDDARFIVGLGPTGLRPVARDTQTIIDDVVLLKTYKSKATRKTS